MKPKIKFSVITAVYNRPDVVGRCIESVNTAYAKAKSSDDCDIELEHIVVNDGSSDNTLEVVKSYSYPHLKVIDLPVNSGPNVARNAAITQADSDYCIFLDSDDYLVPDAINIIAKEIITHPGHGHFLFADDDMLNDYSCNPLLNKSHYTTLEYTDFLAGRADGDFCHVAKTSIAQSHPFDENLRIYEAPVFILFIKAAKRSLFTNEVTTIRERNRSDRVTRESIRFNRKAIEHKAAGLRALLNTFGEDYDRHGLTSKKDGFLIELADNLTLLGDRKGAINTLSQVKKRDKKYKIILTINRLHLNGPYHTALTTYLKIKYRIFKAEVA